MKIRIPTTNFDSLRKQIRDKAENEEWPTWSVVKVKQKDGTSVRRLVHTPSGDDQYKDIQLRFCNPSDEELKEGKFFLDIIPAKASNSKLSDEDLFNKSAIVLGRFSEILNRYFSSLKGYNVILK